MNQKYGEPALHESALRGVMKNVLLFFFCFATTVDEVSNGRCYVDGSKSTDDYTKHHCKDEAAD